MSKQSIIKKYNTRFTKLVQQDISDKNLIKTGDLYKSIDAKFKLDGDEVVIDIDVIYYYVFLDDGTRHIQAFNITEDVTNSSEFDALMEDMMIELLEFELNEKLK